MMQTCAFSLAELAQRRAGLHQPWLEFLNVPTLSMGVYHVPAGTNDRETHDPHDRDEVYVGFEGSGRLTAGGEEFVVEQGSVVFVQAGIKHHFHDVNADLTVLVFFAGGRKE